MVGVMTDQQRWLKVYICV